MSCVSDNFKLHGRWLCLAASLVAYPAEGHTQSAPQAPDVHTEPVQKKPRSGAAHPTARIKTRSLVQSASSSLWLQAGTFDWNALTDQALARAIDEATRSIHDATSVPLTVSPASAMEFDNRRHAFDTYSSLPVERRSDYKLSETAVVGATSKYREDDPRTSLAQSSDQAMAAYFALKASPAFNLDLRAEHGENATAIAGQNAKGSRDTASAKISGAMDLWSFKLAPAVSVASEAERHVSGSAREEGSEKVSVEVAPRISRPFELSYGQKLEPFVMIKGRREVGTTVQGAPLDPSMTRSLGGGVTLAQPDSYSLSVTTEMERNGETAPADLKSKLQLNIPLK